MIATVGNDIKGPSIRQRPISFSTEMIRAILTGRKTQTRRLIAPRPVSPKQLPTCRLGAIGDQLWVRERFCIGANDSIQFGADLDSAAEPPIRWKPAMFMPRSASRIDLRIVEIRAERLRSINPEDALAEGFDLRRGISDPVRWFHALWDSLNDDIANRWRANPWVWVVGFQVLRIGAPATLQRSG